MNAFERMIAAVNGQTPDRVPVSLWFHFGSEHLPPPEAAALHMNYIRSYKWDFLKVMFDYRLKIPDSADCSRKDWPKQLLERTDWEEPFRKQRECVGLIRAGTGGETPIVDTGYSPWHFLLRHVGFDLAPALLARADITEAILDRLADATCAHIAGLRGMKIFGYFYATLAASGAPGNDADSICGRHDARILDSAAGLVRFLHLHGSGVRPERAADYPREVFHCSDSDPSNPGLAVLRKRNSGCLMGGLCEKTITLLSPEKLDEQIACAVRAAGPAGLILAPGCSVSPSISGRTMARLRNSPFLRPALQ